MYKKLVLLLTCLLIGAGIADAQKRVSGTIVDEEGHPVAGANVKAPGSRYGTSTDARGKYAIDNVPETIKKFEVTCIGYRPTSVNATEGARVTLRLSNTDLGEAVATGMQKIDRRMFTGATTKVDAEKVKLDGVPDVSRALEGRVAGVSVQNVSNTFGTAPKIRVRGATSIYGSSKPLWVIDGVIQEDAIEMSAEELSSGDATTALGNAIEGLNADDIESFQVLKDGSATSIYGARAMAGVIVITTKRGRAGHSNISYTGEFTYRMKPSYNQYNICNSQEQLGIYKEMAAKGWLEFASLANGASAGVYGQMYGLMGKYDPETGQFGMENSEAAMNAYLRQAEFRNTNWFDLLFNNNLMHNHSVSISSGTDRASLYASLSTLQDPGWTMDSKVRRYTANVNASFKVSKWVTLNLLTADSYIDQTLPGTLSRSTDPVSGEVSRSFDINPFSYCLNTSRALDPKMTYKRNYAPFNIFDELNNNYQNKQAYDLKFQADLTWKPIEGLELKALGAYRVNKKSLEHIILNHSNMSEAYRAGVDNPNVMFSNPYLYTDPDKDNALPVSVMPVGGIYMNDSYAVSTVDFRGTAQYTKNFNRVHDIQLFGGMESNSVEREVHKETQYGVDYDNARLVTITPELFKQCKEEGTSLASFGKSWSRSVAFFLNATYMYGGRYVINGTVRYDGSNRLGKTRQARWLPTWNISGSWNASEENFFKEFKLNTGNIWSQAVLKVSYSLTGDGNLLGGYGNASPIFYADNIWRPQGNQIETGLFLNSVGNEDLTYEKKHEFNLGMELGFLNNRINLAGDFYLRNCYDLIGMVETQGVGGFIRKYANVANMVSRGVELTLTTHNIDRNHWKWDTDLMFAYNYNRITSLKSRPNVISLVQGQGSSNSFREGYDHDAMFSIPFMGINDEGIPMIINQNGDLTTTNIYFQEYENLGFLKLSGTTVPPFTGGFNNGITWKNLHLNIFMTYSFGNVVRLDPVFSAAYSDMSAMTKDFKNRWVLPGDEKVTDIPAIASKRQYYNDNQLSYAYNAYNYSDARVAKGDFIRLKDISLTYDLPKTWCSKIGISRASIKADATNLWLIYSDKKLNGQDPEFVNSGGVAQPFSKQFTFTVRLGI